MTSIAIPIATKERKKREDVPREKSFVLFYYRGARRNR